MTSSFLSTTTTVGKLNRRSFKPYRRSSSIDEQEARRFLSNLKERLKEELQQADILIVERDVETL